METHSTPAEPRKKHVVFLTGTRADFGKIKSLIGALTARPDRFEVRIFATGMHLDPKYGETIREIEKCNFGCEIFPHLNQASSGALDRTLAHTVLGFGEFVRLRRPDLVVVHGDRSEALAGALVGATNNILVAHIEGGEVSGTIDELLRHAVSKMSHLHFVSNAQAAGRLVQLGEDEKAVYVIGSPDLDVLASDQRPPLSEVQNHYDIPFDQYGVLVWHPVTTQLANLQAETQALIDASMSSNLNWIVIYPNSDPGSEVILAAYDQQLRSHPKYRVFPSLRFESMLVLLEHAKLIVGNSSMGICEAPFYGTPTVNVGSRQQGRSDNPHIIHVPAEAAALDAGIGAALQGRVPPARRERGVGDSHTRFRDLLLEEALWERPVQKRFIDLAQAPRGKRSAA